MGRRRGLETDEKLSVRARNPYSGTFDYEFEATNTAQIVARAQRLREAQSDWNAQGVIARSAKLSLWLDKLRQAAPDIVDALAQDTGRTLLSSVECRGIISRLEYWLQRAPQLLAEKELAPQKLPPSNAARTPGVRYETNYVPYPLVGIISPWNFPLTLALIDAIPALFAGCAALIKPSEFTPRFVEPLAASIKAVPELTDVLAVARGDGSVGEAIIDAADFVCFTGSVSTGHKVALRAARRMIPYCLELGGKDPAIVFEDADLELAATAILRGAAGNAGQACQAIERIYVQQAISEEFIDCLAKHASRIDINHPDRKRGAIGPFIAKQQAEIARLHLQDAIDRGAVAHCREGENIRQLLQQLAAGSTGGGLWCPPITLSNVSHDMLVMREESFAPLLPTMTFDTEKKAIELANDSKYGLSAAVFSADLDRARRVAVALRAGAVSINDASLTAFVDDVEKNSFAMSGLGPSRMGDQGLLRFLRHQALLYQTSAPIGLAAFDESQFNPDAKY